VRAGRDFGAANRHSRNVRRLKFWLPVASALAVGGFLLSTVLSGTVVPEGVEVSVKELALSDGKVVMANPRLTGFTADNQPYEMTADRAIQDTSNSKVVALEGILAKFPFENGTMATVRAKSGNYDDVGKILRLTDAFTIRTENGMAADLNSATINIETGSLWTADAVAININGTTVNADSMKIIGNGKLLIFENRVKMIIDPKNLKSADTSTDAGQTGN
jgi:lipopolysaccharide export system protein LptC